LRTERARPTRPILFPEELPVSGRRDQIAAAIRANPVVIVCGETGSGKTTQLPKICLQIGRGSEQMIGHTQPRRIAASSVARRIAQELRKRGVPDQHIDAAIAQVFADLDEGAMVRKVIERRTRSARGPLDERKMASLYRSLLRAGFDPGVIRRELRAAPVPETAEDLPG